MAKKEFKVFYTSGVAIQADNVIEAAAIFHELWRKQQSPVNDVAVVEYQDENGAVILKENIALKEEGS